jgi:hypothetical protein
LNAGAGIAPLRWYTSLGHLLFMGLLVLSVKHDHLRVVHVDSALQFFKWVQQPGLEVEAHRYTAVLPQATVKIARATGAGLEALMLVASVMHVLVAWAVFALCAHVWHRPWVAAACALAAVLCTRLSFYGMVLEANYLLSYPFLVVAWMEGPMRSGPAPLRTIVLLLLAALSLLVHPVGFLVMAYVGAFFLLAAPELRRPALLLVVVSLLWGLLGRLLLPPSGYESSLYQAAVEGLQSPGGLADMHSFEFLAGHSWRDTAHYLPAWLLLLITWGLLAQRRAWWLLLLVFTGTVGYVLLNVVTYHQGETAVMMEKNFLPLATLIALPLIYELARRPRFVQYLALLPFALVLFLKFRDISFASRPMEKRYVAIEGLVADARDRGVRKGIVDEQELRERGIPVDWALPFETMLIASRDGAHASLTLVSASTLVDGAPEHGVYLAPWIHHLPGEALDKRFFSLPEGPYDKLVFTVR